MTDDERIDRALTQLRIPDGLEQRLAARIDAVADSGNRRRRHRILRWGGASTAAAAVVAAVMLANPGRTPSQQELTPEQVRYYTAMAFDEVSYAFSKGMAGIDMAGQTFEHINQKTKNKPCAN